MYAAKRRGIHLLLTMGNLWAAYKGPEEFLAQAAGSAGDWGHARAGRGAPAARRASCRRHLGAGQGSDLARALLPSPKAPQQFGILKSRNHSHLFSVSKDILDFYGDPRARALFKHHLWVMVSELRANHHAMRSRACSTLTHAVHLLTNAHPSPDVAREPLHRRGLP